MSQGNIKDSDSDKNMNGENDAKENSSSSGKKIEKGATNLLLKPVTMDVINQEQSSI